MSLIYLEDDFITESQSMSIIRYYEDNLNLTYKHGFSHPFTIHSDNLIVKDIVSKITDKCKKFDDNIKLETLEIVKWPFNSRMGYHTDGDSNSSDVFAGMIYLNDNFLGGQTAFDNFQINAKLGRLLIFSNGHYRHSVRRVKFNTRYTLSAWYVKND